MNLLRINSSSAHPIIFVNDGFKSLKYPSVLATQSISRVKLKNLL